MVTAKELCQRLGAFHELCRDECGEEAVDGALNLVTEVCEGADRQDMAKFLRRVARAETDLGRAEHTYREGYHGGIWQVDEEAFEKTHSKDLRLLHASIEVFFVMFTLPGVQWKSVKWYDCRIPCYSALAACLYVATKPPVPTSLRAQASFWKKYYNPNGDVDHFLRVNDDAADAS